MTALTESSQRLPSDSHQRLTPNYIFVGVAASLLAILPVLAAHHLPLDDAPGHEARVAILHMMIFQGHQSPFYEFDSFFLPNVAFDAIGLGLSLLFSPETVGRIFFGLTLVLTLFGVSTLNRVVTGRWSVVVLLGTALLLYNLISILGFFSYAFGLALTPWALAMRLSLERKAPRAGVAFGVFIAILILFCHVFAFAVYAVMSVGFAVSALERRNINLRQFAVRALECVPAAALFLSMSVGRGSHATFERHYFATKVFGAVKSMTSGSMIGDAAFLVGVAALLLIIFSSRTRPVRSFLPGIVALAVAYLVLPFKLASGSYVDSRVPIAIALMFLSGADIALHTGTLAKVLVAVLIASVSVKQIAIALLWRSFDQPIDAIERLLDTLPAGAIIMQAECQPNGDDVLSVYRERQPTMTHLSALATFDDSHFAAATWAIEGQQPIRVKGVYRPFYDLQTSFGLLICTRRDYRARLERIERLAHSSPPASSIYLLLIRPPVSRGVAEEARLISTSNDYELYATIPSPYRTIGHHKPKHAASRHA